MEVLEIQKPPYPMITVPNVLHDKIKDSSDTELTHKRKSRSKQLIDSDSDDAVNSPIKLITNGRRSDGEESENIPKSRTKQLIDSDSDDAVNSPRKLMVEGKRSDGEESENVPNARPKQLFNSDSDEAVNSPRKIIGTGHRSHGVESENISISKPKQLFDSDSDDVVISPKKHSKSRIKSNGHSSDSDSKSDSQITQTSSRIYKRQKGLKSKFNKLLKKNRGSEEHDRENEFKENSDKSASSDSDSSTSSSTKIRKKIQDMNSHLKTTLYDPDTSEDETMRVEIPVRSKIKQKSVKMTSPKPIRMTAKQAMENMQKIKSESNRMLREKEVTLPYHRPKALSLKDIMNKRKLAVAVDGTTLPLKMNNDQLKQFEKMLVERQKEVIQLCKSDSEDEIESDQNIEVNQNNECNVETSSNTSVLGNVSENIEKILEEDKITLDESNNNPEEISDETATMVDHNSTDPSKDNVENTNTHNIDANDTNFRSESDSQLLCLHFDSEKQTHNHEEETPDPKLPLPMKDNIDMVEITKDDQSEDLTSDRNDESSPKNISTCSEKNEGMLEAQIDVDRNDSHVDHQFSDDDLNYEDIDMLIENAEIIKDSENFVNSPALVTEKNVINMKPKLMGGPGMVIDLDGNDSTMPKKMSGVELLKERYTFFSKLKTPDELERQRDKKTKPGMQFLKLKQDLEQEMAEQRSLEWSKRLEQEKQLHMEMNLEETDETDIDKLEEKLQENPSENDESSESEEELIENDCDMEDKPRKSNPMLDDEAEESDLEDGNQANDEVNEDGNSEQEDDESENESSSESEVDEEVKPKKHRILKAFEDSDEEEIENKANHIKEPLSKDNRDNVIKNGDPAAKPSQDEDIQLAQMHRSFSEDLFSTQESGNTVIEQKTEKLSTSVSLEKTQGTQSFSILHSIQDKFEIDKSQRELEELKAIANDIPVSTQIASEPLLPKTQSFGDDVLALCTGNFYNNEFVTQAENEIDGENKSSNCTDGFEIQTELAQTEGIPSASIVGSTTNDNQKPAVPKADKVENCDVLKSILTELDSPEYETPKQKFFTASEDVAKDTEQSVQVKKRFVIDSDDEEETTVTSEKRIKKKSKKKRFEQRALQISDDEITDEDQDDFESESEVEDNEERIVEYDSEENEVELAPQHKKKRKTTDFFEQEAELTSEDEWVGSGDEDERNLDVMEREEGDDEVFHQGKLQRELGQIHMRDVMDQDKREVRIIQELLFEDGDLGDGHRQRKFRWKNMDGTEGDDGIITAFGESQEEDFENEAEWRKERHKREVFLRQMRKNDVDDISDLEIITTTILKSNHTTCGEIDKSALVTEKAAGVDVPSPRKPLGVFQSNYHGSLLSKGESSLARLAALAMPLNTDEDAPKTGLGKGKRNFVFSTITQEDEDVKVTKRKADQSDDSPRTVKRLKIISSRKTLKNSLLDHLNP